MNKHTSSRSSLVLIAVLGIVVVSALVGAWLSDTNDEEPVPSIGAPVRPPPPPDVPPPVAPPQVEVRQDLDRYQPPSDRSWRAGKYVYEAIQGGDLEDAKLRISVNEQGVVRASFQGLREGKGFAIPIRGEMREDGKLYATGHRGPHNARVAGRYEDGQLVGAIQGVIHKLGYRLNFIAPDTSRPPPIQQVQGLDRPTEMVSPSALKDDEIEGTGITKGQLRLLVRTDGTVTGRFQGIREGKGFSIPFKGKVQQDGEVDAAGKRGPNEVHLSGRYASGRLEGVMQGAIYGNGYRVEFNAD